ALVPPAPIPIPLPAAGESESEPSPAAEPPKAEAPAPAPAPQATPAPAPSPAPSPASTPAPAEPATAAALASIYPLPPPEKPAPPAKAAAAAGAPAPGRGGAAALLEASPHGPLPRIAPDGRLPWIVNNSRFDHGTRLPRLGVVVTGLGLNPDVTEDAIVRLPAEITLAFIPYAQNLPRWIQLAREFGHEVLISLPLESDAPSDTGLGPRALSTRAGAGENLDRLRWVLARSPGYVGVVTWEGEKFLADGLLAAPVLQELAQRGLLVMDSRQAKSNIVQQLADSLGLPFAKSRGFLDSEPGVGALDRNLQQLEAIARRSGFGVAMAVAFPETVQRLVDWSKTVGQRGFVLAPITGVTECRELCQQRVARHAAAVSTAGR
ncbi:MAG: divergent polysaccharide deacetylase family protein, partial [Reyranellaceae bacterium]